MTRTLSLVLLLATVAQSAVAADCYADYKAKQDKPLKLHYGVMQLAGDCSKPAAGKEIARRLNDAGWTLLSVQSIFGPDGLDKRKSDAGSYFLRF
ncbi:hypothetical protein TRIHO_03460 [Tritonibacter horizontis]|uniref:Uncharacterized protein n=2 Tax=Tritonibacter horizontis TaxID=1768241 RepID=A0A132C325_9RHOB|nr:hypothetical protein TRIHO_03460 [Tritonibacter horizontis]